MREILFRGKRVDNGEWVEGCFIYGVKQKKGKSYILPENIDQPGCHHLDGFEVMPETVGQFTGLLDKNGTKIFEGDIIKNIQAAVNIVHWYGAEFCYQNYHAEALPLDDLWNPYESENSGHEVIGNIHDNKELLK